MQSTVAPGSGRWRLRAWLAVLAVLAVVLGAGALGAWQAPVLALLDAEFRWLAAHTSDDAPDPVTVIGIDDATYTQFAEPSALWYAHYADLLAALGPLHPRAVLFDVVLPEKSYQIEGAPPPDLPLLRAVAQWQRSEANVPLVFALAVRDGAPVYPAPRLRALLEPDHLGLAVLQPDADGVLRRFDLPHELRALSLPGRIATALHQQLPAGLIDYAAGAPMEYLPMQDAIAQAGHAQVLRPRIEGRVVLVGDVTAYGDRKRAALPLAAWLGGSLNVPGVLVQAQLLRSALGRGLVIAVPVAAQWALVLAMSALFWLRPRRVLLLLPLVCAALLWGATQLLSRHLYLDAAVPMVMALAAVGGRLALEAWAAARERRHLKASFEGYVSPAVLDEILAGRLHAGSGARRVRIAVLFSDIRGFTARSERAAPEAIVALLNRYFSTMTDIVHAHGGTVDKFLGDGLMAFFGAPQPSAQPGRAAFEAACAMLRALPQINAELAAAGEAPLAIGIGLHLGDAVVGHVGSARRNEYTAIGDAVNLAARLQDMTKEFSMPLICSDDVAREQGGGAGLAPLGSQAVRGRSAVVIHGWAPAAGDA